MRRPGLLATDFLGKLRSLDCVMFDQSCALESLERQLIDRKSLYLLRALIALLVMSELLSDSGMEAVDQSKGHYSYQRCNNIDNNTNLQWVFRKERVGNCRYHKCYIGGNGNREMQNHSQIPLLFLAQCSTHKPYHTAKTVAARGTRYFNSLSSYLLSKIKKSTSKANAGDTCNARSMNSGRRRSSARTMRLGRSRIRVQ